MRILDMTAGNRAVWLKKRHPDAVYVDLRIGVGPDVVADSGVLPFADGVFGLVVFDPPHVNSGANSNVTKSYGYWTAAAIRSFVERGAREAHRCTIEGALMSFKWSTHDQRLEVVLGLMARWWEPLVGAVTTMTTDRRRMTQWVLLRRV